MPPGSSRLVWHGGGLAVVVVVLAGTAKRLTRHECHMTQHKHGRRADHELVQRPQWGFGAEDGQSRGHTGWVGSRGYDMVVGGPLSLGVPCSRGGMLGEEKRCGSVRPPGTDGRWATRAHVHWCGPLSAVWAPTGNRALSPRCLLPSPQGPASPAARIFSSCISVSLHTSIVRVDRWSCTHSVAYSLCQYLTSGQFQKTEKLQFQNI